MTCHARSAHQHSMQRRHREEDGHAPGEVEVQTSLQPGKMMDSIVVSLPTCEKSTPTISRHTCAVSTRKGTGSATKVPSSCKQKFKRACSQTRCSSCFTHLTAPLVYHVLIASRNSFVL